MLRTRKFEYFTNFSLVPAIVPCIIKDCDKCVWKEDFVDREDIMEVKQEKVSESRLNQQGTLIGTNINQGVVKPGGVGARVGRVWDCHSSTSGLDHEDGTSTCTVTLTVRSRGKYCKSAGNIL